MLKLRKIGMLLNVTDDADMHIVSPTTPNDFDCVEKVKIKSSF